MTRRCLRSPGPSRMASTATKRRGLRFGKWRTMRGNATLSVCCAEGSAGDGRNKLTDGLVRVFDAQPSRRVLACQAADSWHNNMQTALEHWLESGIEPDTGV